MADRQPRRILETRRLSLREFIADDATAMEGVFCDPEVMRYSDGLSGPDWVREWLRCMIEDGYPRWGFGMWAVEEKASRAVIGYCGFDRTPGRCGPDEGELGYRLIRGRWGLGLATEAAGAACDFGLRSLGFSRVFAMVDPGNLASVRVLQKLGLRYQGEVLFEGYDHPDHVYAISPPATAESRS